MARQARAALSRAAQRRAGVLLPPEAALARTRAVVQRDTAWITAPVIETVSTLTHGLRATVDPAGQRRWLHHRWVMLFEEMMDTVGPDAPPRPYHALCLGAGLVNPLALPLLLFLGGAERVWVVEPTLAGPGAEWRLRGGIEELALRVLVGDVRSRHFTRAPAELDGFADLRGLFFGPELAGALRADTVRLLSQYFEDAPVPDASVHLLTSRSVLEHVTETERCFDAMTRVMAPGGVMFHWIDLSAHDDGDPFAFYYEPPATNGARRSDGLNGLRLSDYLAAFRARGFACRVVDPVLITDYDLHRRPLLPRYQRYDEDDLRCRRAVIVARASAAVRA